MTSAEWRQLFTARYVFQQGGHYAPPPSCISKAEDERRPYCVNPPGTVASCHASGWIQREFFVEWMSHFVECVKPMKQQYVLLLLDGHHHTQKTVEQLICT
jgi:hypothetical protein